MPTYDYQCNECKTQFSKLLRMSDRKTPELEPCPECQALAVEQVLFSAPSIGDPVRIGVTKKDSNFTEVLKGIHSKTAGSKIDSYL